MKQASNSVSIFRLTFIFNVLLILYFIVVFLSYPFLFLSFPLILHFVDSKSLLAMLITYSHERCTCLLLLILYDDQFDCFLLWFEIGKFSTIHYFT